MTKHFFKLLAPLWLVEPVAVVLAEEGCCERFSGAAEARTCEQTGDCKARIREAFYLVKKLTKTIIITWTLMTKMVKSIET